MADSDIATSYATALLEALKSPDDLQRVGKDLESIAALLADVPSIPRLLDNPGQPMARRLEVLDGLLNRLKAHDATRRFFHLVLEKGRVRDLHEIIARFQKLRDERLNLATAEVTTAVPLEPKLRAEWERRLAKMTGREVRVTYKTDSGLLGGALTRVGSVVYDGSLRTQLSRFRERLVKG
ncbi:MAG: ATP synthase F1 subunit delta [Candidatus Polarisedimenticolia bacterium]